MANKTIHDITSGTPVGTDEMELQRTAAGASLKATVSAILSLAPLTAAGSATQVQYNKANLLTGDAGLTYDETLNVLSLNGSANTLSLAGSATTAPVTLTAGGSDTNISIKLAPKGLGFIQAGPDTGITASAGEQTCIEAYRATATSAAASGIYARNVAGDIASSQSFGMHTDALTAGIGATQDVSFVIGGYCNAQSLLPVGRTAAAVYGVYASGAHTGNGSVTNLAGIYAGVQSVGPAATATAVLASAVYAGTGGITNAIGVDIAGLNTSGGAITTGYGLRIADIVGASTNYAIKTGAGLVQFGALTASQIVLTDANKNLVSAGAKPTITGSRGGNAALADLLTKGAALGLWVDSTS